MTKLTKVNQTPVYEDVEDFDEVAVEVETQEETPTAVVVPTKTKALSSVGGKYAVAFKDQHLAIDLVTVEDIGQGTMPKIVADRGGFSADDKEYGDEIDVELVSFNDRLVITPGVDGEEAKQLLRYSYDGQTLAGEPDVTVASYVADLKDAGFPRAEAKKYIDLWVMPIRSQVDGDIAEEDRDLVQVQLSPSSVREWNKFMLQASVKMSRAGVDIKPLLNLKIDKREYNGNKYAAIKFDLAK